MSNNSNHTPEIKKNLISLLMFQIYSEQRTIYREYVQNALDSINEAVKNHILNENKDGKVEILIDPKLKIVTIKDNGTGISEENAVKTLLDISSSTKDGISQAGQFGIGRLVGGGYCHKLIFKTSAQGEEIGTKVVFDIDKIWHMVKEDDTDYLATYVISNCTSTETFSSNKDEHFFEVILDGIKEESASILLDKDKVIKYLEEVAPVEYTSSFSNTLIYNALKTQPKYNKLYENLDKVQVFVNSRRIQKQYGLTIKGTKDEIGNLELFTIENEEFGMLAWGWFALTKFSIQIPKSDDLAGFRLRKHNIQIGNSNLLSGKPYWREERGNSYFYGELFVTHPGIMPNAARDGLAPTQESIALNTLLTEYFENLRILYTRANMAKKCVDKIKEAYDRAKSIGEFDYKCRDLYDNRGVSAFERLIKNASFGPTQRMLLLYKPDLDEAKSKVDALKSSFEKPKENDSTNEPEAAAQNPNPQETMSTGSTSSGGGGAASPASTENVNPPTKDNEGSSGDHQDNQPVDQPEDQSVDHPEDPHPNEQQEPSTAASPLGGNLLNPTTTHLLAGKDIVAQLDGALEPSEVFLVRRIFRVLSSYCPANEHDQSLIRSMKECIVRELSNG